MEAMVMKKTNVTFSSGLPPCPKRPNASPHLDTDQATRSCGGADEAKPGSVGQMATALNYENTTHSRSNSSETVDDIKEPGQNNSDGRSWSEIDIQFELARRLHPDMDPRKLRRIVTNRISAQRSRLRKIKYVTNLEYMKVSLQAKISQISFEIASESNKKEELLTEKMSLKQKMSFLADDGILKNAEKKLLTKEVDRLVQVLLRQKQEQEVDANIHSWVGSENDCVSDQYDELQQLAMLWSDPTSNYCGLGTGGDGNGSASLSHKYNGVDDVMIKCETTQDLLSIN